jgi:hypothetical protein
MKAKLLFFFFFVLSQTILAKPVIEFISPQANSKYVKVSSSITLRFSADPESHSINENTIQITGSKSGIHISDFKFSKNGRTIIFTPKAKFQYDEMISVKIMPIKTEEDFSDPISLFFNTEKENIPVSAVKEVRDEAVMNSNLQTNFQIPFNQNRISNLPADFPPISILNSSGPSNGYLFLSNFALSNASIAYYLMILDNAGTPVFYRKLDTAAYDFKKQPNGNLTYYYSKAQKFYEMNHSYQITDSFACGNGYPTDLHELLVYPDGSSFLMSYDPQRIDMSDFVPNGDTNAIVIGLIIQELDADKNVVFQWRSWDHFNITDATHEDLTSHVIDYAHGNSIALSNDGNIIISSRHMDEITKINRNTGNIIWRLGGKRNQFNFTNDEVRFSHQHSARQLPNGNLTLFDNGNYRTRTDTIHLNRQVSYSRALEYSIDEVNRTVTMVWDYVSNPPIFGFAMGYTERLPNGNTIIGWGAANPTVTEVNPARQKVFEMSLPPGQVTYRVFRDTWDPLPNNGIPLTYSVYQNYPNPFNPGTTIKYDLPEQSDVKITIFNILGQTIREEVRLSQTPGIYSYIFNGSDLTSGVYFYRVKSNSFSDTKRMVLVK